VKFTFNERAKSANEQQETPSNKSCSKKNGHRNLSHDSAQRTNEVSSFHSCKFFRSQLTLLNCFSNKPSPFKLIAFVGKLDQDSGANS
jgi:hypothetical protein